MGRSERGGKAQDPGALLVEGYAALLRLSSRMLEAARAADWEALLEQESHYVVQVERLKRWDAQQPLEGELAERKAALLERILEQDLEIRRRLVARRDELSELIGTSRRQQALQRAYGASPGAVTIDARQRFGKQES